MLFSSPVFLFLFLPIVLWLYVITRRELRNPLLLAASLLFYAWGEKGYTVVMLLSIAMNYVFGLVIDRLPGRRAAWWALCTAVAANLLLLGAMKYANFFVDNLNRLLALVHASPIELSPVHLPIGISFFTFHAISYVVDIYRRDTASQRNPLDLALYIALFPQLVAGPIIRYRDVADELTARTMRWRSFSDGVLRFAIGLGKKVLIANTLALPADRIFKVPAAELPAGVAWLGILCYTFQIYFDFSGYSDMAVGLGRMFGFHFTRNFNYPYISQSITEFWRRWHISLSSFFRDYLYIPLGGNRCAPWKVYRNLLVVFLLCGFWHGAAWQYMAWGLFHGMLLVVERFGLTKLLVRIPSPLRHGYALLMVIVGWVFFRAENMGYAVKFLAAMGGLASSANELAHPLARYMTNDVFAALLVAPLAATPILPWCLKLYRRTQRQAKRQWRPAAAPMQFAWQTGRLVGMAALLVAAAVQLASSTYNPFIYFQF
jgi:alginate O-acetyltransferase complex protein AlgI